MNKGIKIVNDTGNPIDTKIYDSDGNDISSALQVRKISIDITRYRLEAILICVDPTISLRGVEGIAIKEEEP